MGEDPRTALFKVEFCPDELTGEEAVTLSAYYTSWAVGWFKVYNTSQIGGFDRNWRKLVSGQVKTIFPNPVARRWLKKFLSSGDFIVANEIREVAEAALAEAPGRSRNKDLYAAILAENPDAVSCATSISSG